MSELTAGSRLPERTFGPVTLTDIVRYQGASGDMNPIHHDDEFARAAGFPAAIGVGMLGAGWLAAYCTEHLGEESVRRFRTRFSAVVYRGDRLTASAEVVRLFARDGETRVELAVRLRKDDGSVVIVTGTVPDEATHHALLKSARETPGVKSVKDDLKVQKKH